MDVAQKIPALAAHLRFPLICGGRAAKRLSEQVTMLV